MKARKDNGRTDEEVRQRDDKTKLALKLNYSCCFRKMN